MCLKKSIKILCRPLTSSAVIYNTSTYTYVHRPFCIYLFLKTADFQMHAGCSRWSKSSLSPKFFSHHRENRQPAAMTRHWTNGIFKDFFVIYTWNMIHFLRCTMHTSLNNIINLLKENQTDRKLWNPWENKTKDEIFKDFSSFFSHMCAALCNILWILFWCALTIDGVKLLTKKITQLMM